MHADSATHLPREPSNRAKARVEGQWLPIYGSVPGRGGSSATGYDRSKQASGPMHEEVFPGDGIKPLSRIDCAKAGAQRSAGVHGLNESGRTGVAGENRGQKPWASTATIAQWAPIPRTLLSLEAEELAGVLLEHLNAMYPEIIQVGMLKFTVS